MYLDDSTSDNAGNNNTVCMHDSSCKLNNYFVLFRHLRFFVLYFFVLSLAKQRANLLRTAFIFMIRIRTGYIRLHRLIFQGKGHPGFGRDALIIVSVVQSIRYLIHLQTDCIFRHLKGTNIFAVL